MTNHSVYVISYNLHQLSIVRCLVACSSLLAFHITARTMRTMTINWSTMHSAENGCDAFCQSERFCWYLAFFYIHTQHSRLRLFRNFKHLSLSVWGLSTISFWVKAPLSLYSWFWCYFFVLFFLNNFTKLNYTLQKYACK